MKIVTTSYINTSEFNDPLAWLERINFHTGVLERLSKHHEINSIEQINYSGKLVRNGVTYHFLNYKKAKQYFPYRLHRYIKKMNPDIVWIHGFIFPFQLMQLRFQLGRHVKIIVQNHAEKPSAGWRKLLQQLADNFVHKYYFTSKEMGLEWVNKKIISDKKKIAEVMEVSSAFDSLEEKTISPPNHLSFLWVGRLDSNKDPLTVVKAFIEFVQQQPLAKLYMIYHTEELLEKVKELIRPAPENICLVGRVDHKQLYSWYTEAGFIISGSHFESGGIAVCEAMSCGCIPIVTNIAAFRKITGNGKCGLLYQPGDRKELLSALLKTQNMDLIFETEKASKQFADELSFEAIAMKMNETINALEANV